MSQWVLPSLSVIRQFPLFASKLDGIFFAASNSSTACASTRVLCCPDSTARSANLPCSLSVCLTTRKKIGGCKKVLTLCRPNSTSRPSTTYLYFSSYRGPTKKLIVPSFCIVTFLRSTPSGERKKRAETPFEK
jgi:hypothetical protein